METITKPTTTKDILINEYESLKDSLFGDSQLRKNAIGSFTKLGIPNRKHEEYKYTNIELMLKGEFGAVADKATLSSAITDLKIVSDSFLAVVVNGIFSESLSQLQNLPKGVTISGLSEASKNNAALYTTHFGKYADIDSDGLIALNTALVKDGVFIHIAKNVVCETPIQILHLATASENVIINPRNLVVVADNAQVKIIESFETVDATHKTFTNALTEMVVSENAIVDHYKLQNESKLGYLMNTFQVVQKAKSVFTTNSIILDGSLIRNNLNIVLDGEHIESNLNGLYLTKGAQVVDNHTLVDHQKPNCNSNELYKGIIEDKSTATFNGKIFVRKDAQITNAFQSNKNILLSDDGTINTKPQLEIYADDVKCSHGTSTGKLDEDKIFYLRARGLSELSAKKLLMHAFASEVINLIKIDEFRDLVETEVSKRFE